MIDQLGWGFVEDFDSLSLSLSLSLSIWNLLEELVIVVVVCSGDCWFLVGGDCHWAMHLCICWVLSKYIFNVLYILF